jgi:hypothetical protein
MPEAAFVDGGNSGSRRNKRRRLRVPLYSSPPDNPMNVHLSIGPLISLVAGVLILVMPRLLNYIIAIYLIIIGLVGLFGTRL